MLLRLVERDEAAFGAPAPQRSLVMVQKVSAHPRRAPGAAAVHAFEAVLALQMSKSVRRRHRARRSERPNRRREPLRQARLGRKVRLAERRAQQRVVPSRDEVQRLPHHGRLDDLAARELPLERRAPEDRRPRPDPDIRCLRPLRLHPNEPLDHGGRREALPLEQQLARKRRAIELAQREDALGHGAHPT